MSRSENHGKRGSNAGDDFHELWALRRALEVIHPRSSVQEVTVEGVLPEDEDRSEGPEWDGVDCALYSGPSIDEIQHIELAQLKYSGANPDKPWTIARLTYSSNKSRNNSVIARLAEAYSKKAKLYPKVAIAGRIEVSLVSNQPASLELAKLKDVKPDQEALSEVRKATGLSSAEFSNFLSALNFSKLGFSARHAVEEKLVLDIAAWDPVDTAAHVNNFRRFIRDRMMPGGQRVRINRESILSVFQVGLPEALFPCPSRIERVDSLVPRQATRTIVELWQDGKTKVCLHGQGGEGKTTVLQDIAKSLPENSVMVSFDCYGGGTYLNSDGYRHRPQDAFVQLANDASASLLLPFLATRSRDADYPRLFAERLRRVAKSLQAADPKALLVVAVDAADNAITAASKAPGDGVSFIPDFLSLGTPPDNVRILISARSGRLDQLGLPDDYVQVPLGGFTEEETQQFFVGAIRSPTDEWIAQVQRLSGGNPRVLRYALGASQGNESNLLAYLQPNGKNLSGIFDEILKEAFKKVGSRKDVQDLCAALTLLPRPIPFHCLAGVTRLSEAHVRDIISDLSFGLIVDDGKVGFRDEDFEAFLDDAGAAQAASILDTAADFLANEASTDSYAAEHAADVLHRARRSDEVLHLAGQDIASYPINDPALRTLVYQRRMRAAIRSCRTSQNTADAMDLLLAGADSFRKDAAIRELLFDHPDLSAHFSQDQMQRILLADPSKRSDHGSFLMHSAYVAARHGDRFSFRQQSRSIRAWLDNAAEQQRTASRDHLNGEEWVLKAKDIAAWMHGFALIDGIGDAAKRIMRARPVSFRQRIRSSFIERLALSGEFELLAGYLALLPRGYPGKGLSQVFLALAGQNFDLKELMRDLERHAKAILPLFRASRDNYQDAGTYYDVLELVLIASEIAVINGGSKTRLKRLLAAFCTRDIRQQVSFHRHVNLADNFALRAYVLLRAMQGKDAKADGFILIPAVSGRSKKALEKKRERVENLNRARARIDKVIPTYQLRADIILGRIDLSSAIDVLRVSLKSATGEWQYEREGYEVRSRDHALARSLFTLSVFDEIAADDLLDTMMSIFKEYEFPAQACASDFLRRAQLVPRLVPAVLEKIRGANALWREEKIPANDKIEVITRYSRLALLQSADTANAGFNLAVEVASEIDAESVHALAICDILADKANVVLSSTERSSIASNLTAIAQDVGIRVGSDGGFPWKAIANTLAQLAFPHALAACARFNETGLIDLDELLEPMLLSALEKETIDIEILIALAELLERPSADLLSKLATSNSSLTEEALEYLARDALLRNNGAISSLSTLFENNPRAKGPHSRSLAATARFLDRPSSQPAGRNSRARRGSVQQTQEFDWKVIETVGDLAAAITEAVSEIRENGGYTSNEEVFSTFLKSVPDYRRVDILDYIAEDAPALGLNYSLGEFLHNRLSEWECDPAVRRWCRQKLLPLVARYLPEVSRYIEMGQSRLPRLVKFAEADAPYVIDALLNGVEQHVDELHSASVYFLAAEIAKHASAEDCSIALSDHVARRHSRLDTVDRHLPNMDHVPAGEAQGIARFVFAQLGSPVVPLRWRAAHAVRRLASLGQVDLLHELSKSYPEKGDPSFGHPDAPAYILSSRLWFIVGLARAAWEAPSTVLSLKHFLFVIGEDNEFPHVLIKAFAQLALRGLVANCPGEMSESERRRVDAINRPQIPKAESKHPNYYSTFEKYGTDHTKGRRFDFDTMDTLPYLYNRAVAGFADPDASKFLDIAERWIVDEWGAPKRAYEIDAQRRGRGFWNRDSLSSSTSHGSRPSLESYRTYLEFHAMHCAIGEFLVTEPLAAKPDEYDRFDNWLAGQGLTAAPLWLSDLREPKPAEMQFWQKPEADKSWLKKRETAEIRRELGLDDPDWLTLASDHWASGDSMSQMVRIETCLVSPKTATSLRRALEASDNSYEYRLAIGDDHEIDEGDFMLKAILKDCNTESSFDEHDRWRGDLGPPSIEPMRWVLETLKLTPCSSGQHRWHDSFGVITIENRAWSDDAQYGNSPDFRYRVHGRRLVIRRSALRHLLNEMKLDLAVELTMRRSIGENRRYTGVEKEEVEFDRIIIYRQNGRIEATGKRLGNWQKD